ncbi:MAG: Fe-S cluster assembly protein SufD [Ahniella sp.]|nr:Fe-S cluster assembly protein SufD [Ahniella sp.]
MSGLLEELLAHPLDRSEQNRLRARERLRIIGLPDARHEGWRYTPVRSLLTWPLHAPEVDPEVEVPELPEDLIEDLEALEPDFIYVDGVMQEEEDESDDEEEEFEERFDNFEDLPDFDEPDLDRAQPYSRLHPDFLEDGFELANIAFNQGGLVLDIDAESGIEDGVDPDAEQTLVLAYVSSSEPAGFPHVRHRIRVGAGQSLTLVEHFLHEPDSKQALNLGHEIELEAGATLRWVRMGDMGDANQLLGFARLRLEAGASVHLYELTRGAGLYRQATQVDLSGVGARCEATAVLAIDGRRHADLQWRVDHRARDTSADLKMRGLVSGRGKLSVGGSLIVHAGADGTDTRLSNKNLLLSEHAEVNTKPVLEIDADEVKAAHGATVGQLDERALFYMRSRGLPETLARQLLTRAFAFEVISGVDDDSLKALLDMALTKMMAKPA